MLERLSLCTWHVGEMWGECCGRENRQQTKPLVAQNGPFGALALAPESPPSPEKVYVGPLLCRSPEMRHITFLGPETWGFWVGGGLYVEKVYVLFESLNCRGRFMGDFVASDRGWEAMCALRLPATNENSCKQVASALVPFASFEKLRRPSFFHTYLRHVRS